MRWRPPRSIILFLVYQIMEKKTKKERRKDRRPVGSLGRVPDYRAGGRGFKPRPDQHSGSLK